jgi:glycine cleavage system aminomethyltransferase T
MGKCCDCYTGELGWELHVPAESCVPVYQALMEEGRDLGLVNAGYRAIDSLSMEKVRHVVIRYQVLPYNNLHIS